ncbi:protein transport protein sec61 gamma subunit [Stylonychia lemnae]|uniref:Protein transport protein sec61 gamma subunit n=1 Tax=Stylonychia lemnae TaxID=5949 RepID=A0A078AG82_STYLE|nr:protein transport protein sec61 gamma subunit [Stylonychia lemnae]|eukprot:CDW80841.1 protein transport protein sec61 gamma subunit [Stylonychia lemnae]
MSSAAKLRREEKNKNVVNQLQDFANDSIVFFNKCAKPDRNEYMKILQACAMGFIVIGFIGYIIKLVFIPINNIILGA